MMRQIFTYAAIIAVAIPLITWVAKPKQRVEYEDGKIVIEWYNYATPEFLKLYTDHLIPEFEKSHPNIKIRLNSSMGDTGYDAKLLTLIAGRLSPDVIHVTQANFPFYAVKDILLDVNPLIEKDPDFDINDYFEPVMDGMRYEGELLGLPSDFSTIVLLYNKRLFDKYGVPYPDYSWDWDDFLSAAKKLTRDTDGDGVTDQFGFVNIKSYNRWPAWIYMAGGRIFSPDMKRCTMDDPKSIEGLKFYIDLSTKHHVAPTAAESIGQDFQELFLTERAAMIADSRYAYKRFAKGVTFPWDAGPMPKGRERVTTFIWGGNAILKSTKHPKEAWEFLKFLSGYEGAVLNVKAGNALPAHKGVAMSDLVLKSELSPPNDKAYIEAIEYGRQAPFPPQFSEFNQAIMKLDAAFLGLEPTDDVCREFAKDVNEAMSGEVW